MDVETTMIATAAYLAEHTLELLATKVRAMTLEQIVIAPVTRLGARSALRRLERRGLIRRQIVMMEPILNLSRPVTTWSPGDRPPAFGEVSWRLRSRWRECPRRTMVYTATDLARDEHTESLGSRRLRPSEIRHDCHVAEVYRQLAHCRPELAANWVHEDAFAGRFFSGDRIPDAAIADGSLVAIDFGGSYRASKLLSLHRAMESQNIPYEVW
jgi:hypothetical protein